MLRITLCVALGWFVVAAAFSHLSEAAEPRSKEADGKIKARELVFGALEAEASGDNERRKELLTEARNVWPELAETNWHLGRVNAFGGWLPIDEAVAAAIADTNLAKYDELRAKAASVREIRELARWCQKHGYADRARLHYAHVLARADADAEQKAEAVKELDLVRVGEAWLTREELATRTAEGQKIDVAVTKWGPRLKRLQSVIDGDDFKRREASIAEFHKIDDPALIPVLPLFIAEGGDRFQEEAVKRLAAFDEHESTAALVKYALHSEYSFVRSLATRELSKRPLHEFVPRLLGGLIAPVKTQYQVKWDKSGVVNYAHAFLREGPTENMLLISQNLATPVGVPVRINPTVTPRGVRINDRQAALASTLDRTQSAIAIAQSQAETFNSNVADANRRIFAVLEQSTNQQLPQEPIQWWNWWQSYNGYQAPRQTRFVQQSNHQQYVFAFRTASCFVAGTPIRTESGTVSVESIQPGDRVLSQDPDTGELGFKVVLATTVRPPTKTVRVMVGDEPITATVGHPFWVNGEGWKMAKELGAGDLLHSLDGSVKVEKVEPASDAPAHNLVVDDFNTYFVGHQALLVHDNNFRRPTRTIVPGLVRKK